MRQPRLKPEYKDTWHHCYNRAVGTAADRPMADADREAFVRILHRACRLYTVEGVACQALSNHLHLLVHAPEALPSAAGAACASPSTDPPFPQALNFEGR